MSATRNDRIRKLARLLAMNLGNGTLGHPDLIAQIKRMPDPLEAAYLALNVASYLPDLAEATIRIEIGKAIYEAQPTAEAPNPPVTKPKKT